MSGRGHYNLHSHSIPNRLPPAIYSSGPQYSYMHHPAMYHVRNPTEQIYRPLYYWPPAPTYPLVPVYYHPGHKPQRARPVTPVTNLIPVVVHTPLPQPTTTEHFHQAAYAASQEAACARHHQLLQQQYTRFHYYPPTYYSLPPANHRQVTLSVSAASPANPSRRSAASAAAANPSSRSAAVNRSSQSSLSAAARSSSQSSLSAAVNPSSRSSLSVAANHSSKSTLSAAVNPSSQSSLSAAVNPSSQSSLAAAARSSSRSSLSAAVNPSSQSSLSAAINPSSQSSLSAAVSPSSQSSLSAAVSPSSQLSPSAAAVNPSQSSLSASDNPNSSTAADKQVSDAMLSHWQSLRKMTRTARFRNRKLKRDEMEDEMEEDGYSWRHLQRGVSCLVDSTDEWEEGPAPEWLPEGAFHVLELFHDHLCTLCGGHRVPSEMDAMPRLLCDHLHKLETGDAATIRLSSKDESTIIITSYQELRETLLAAKRVFLPHCCAEY